MSKKKIALIVLGVFVLLLGILMGVIASRPADFSVSRSVVVNASAERIFPYLNNFKLSQQWSPFEKLDPDMKREFSGPAQGVGAVYAWEGNSSAGAGKLTILESQPYERVYLQLDFYKPMEGTNYTEYRIEPVSEGNHRVVWTMSGKHNFIGKAVCLIMNMDKAVGGMFEEGLASLKRLTETHDSDMGT